LFHTSTYIAITSDPPSTKAGQSGPPPSSIPPNQTAESAKKMGKDKKKKKGGSSSKSKTKTKTLPSNFGKGGKNKKRAGPNGAPGAVREMKPAEPNMYDVFSNRKRHSAILGERTLRGEKRNVAKSRATASANRTTGLLRDMQTLNKKSKFKDAREQWSGEGQEDVERFVKLRQRQTKRTFNLDGKQTEELTIRGKPLSGLKDEDLKKDGGGWEEEEEDIPLDALDTGLSDVVMRSKQRKAEAAKEKQDQESMLNDLDAGFADIMGELNFRGPKAMQPFSKDDAPDNYDMLVKKLGTERRVAATERTKTAEELAREKAEKLEALERKRVARAQGIDLEKDLGSDDDEEGEGGKTKGDDESDDNLGDVGVVDDDDDGESGESEESGEGEESDGEGDGDEEAENIDEDDKQGEGCPHLLTIKEAASLNIMANDSDEKGLPFAPECPRTAVAVASLLDKRSPKTALKLVERVRTCAASLGSEKKARMRTFFVSLLEYIASTLGRSDGDLSIRGAMLFHALRGPLVDFATEFPKEAFQFFEPMLMELEEVVVPTAGHFCKLKLMALIFPVTDKEHPICTPATILADRWAANLAKLGSGIEDLISEASLLWGILYDFLSPGKRFSSSFFSLGSAVLASAWASAVGGRAECAEALAAYAAMMTKVIGDLAEEDDQAAAMVAKGLVRPTVNELVEAIPKAPEAVANSAGAVALKELARLLNNFSTMSLEPLAYFQTGPAEIRVLDPIFHEIGGRLQKGMEMTESKVLKKKLNKERRKSSRQLARDAATLQMLASQKDKQLRAKRSTEKRRVTRIMQEETQMLKQLATETGGGHMDTSIKRYSAKKETKAANRRLGGNQTAENKKEIAPRPVKVKKALRGKQPALS